ncbi:hypothetical protein SLS56_010418 [Neofusicoccum ribis]|uniref:Uncharacterized protein n=1 Tax=Neofusicoccum ribis TaxID=45134 RepID=A0ABR3SEG9_9PEZI
MNSFDPTKPIDRVFDALGSNHNRARLNDPYGIEGPFNPVLDSSVESDEATAELMELLANIFFVSNYLNQEDVKERFFEISNTVHDLMERIKDTTGSYCAGLTAARDEYLL